MLVGKRRQRTEEVVAIFPFKASCDSLRSLNRQIKAEVARPLLDSFVLPGFEAAPDGHSPVQGEIMFNKSNLFSKSAEPVSQRSTSVRHGLALGSAGGDASSSVAPAANAIASPAPERAVTASASGANSVASSVARSSAADSVEHEPVTGSRLIVGPDVKLKGAEILDCDTLVVEGRVEATMDSRVIRIAENGAYEGTVGIDVAEIHGRFEGELTARQQLIIHATGRVSGKIRYGKILIEEGGEISGDVQSLAKAAAKEGLRAVDGPSSAESKLLAAVAG